MAAFVPLAGEVGRDYATTPMRTTDPRRLRLRGWLQDYHYPSSDPRERAHHDAMLALVDGEHDPFDPLHLDPGHFTASAFVLSPDRQALMLIFHRKLSRWLQPGGHVETMDVDLLAAARREVMEETGVASLELERHGIFDVDVHAIPARADLGSHHHFDVRFLFRATNMDLTLNNEVSDARWVPLSAIHEFESDESVLRAVRKIGNP